MSSPQVVHHLATHESAPTFTVLFVCTGNICRSPIAERLLAARLTPTERAAVRSISAGTQAVSGYPMDALAADALRTLGGNPDRHVARQITAEMVRDADLVLTATNAHRSRIVRDQPAAMRRTFTLREFARLGDDLGAPRPRTNLSERVREVAAQRGIVEVVDPAADEIGDPFGASAEVMQACGDLIADAVDSVLRILALGQDG